MLTGDQEYFKEMVEYNEDAWRDAFEEFQLPKPVSNDILGCGYFGCVFGTEDPKVAVKITNDELEIALMRVLHEGSVSGFVKVFDTIELNRNYTAIWRDRLDLCCMDAMEKLQEIYDMEYPPMQEDVEGATYSQHIRAYELTVDEDDEGEEALIKMSRVPGLRDLANGLLSLIEFNRMSVADIHIRNVGVFNNYDQLIVFDAELEPLIAG